LKSEYNFESLIVEPTSRVFLNPANITADKLVIKKDNSKTDQARTVFQFLATDTLIKSVDIVVTDSLKVDYAEVGGINLKADGCRFVDLKSSSISSGSSDDVGIALDIKNTNDIVIDEIDIINYEQGIKIDNDIKKRGSSGRLTNNSVNFTANVEKKHINSKKNIKLNKSKIGIDINNLDDIVICNNLVINGDTAIVVKGSSGRLTNNSINFTANVEKSLYKTGFSISNCSNFEIDSNLIVGIDSSIVIKSSSGRLTNNSINFTANVEKEKVASGKLGVIIANCNNYDIQNNKFRNFENNIIMSRSSGRLTNNSINFTANVEKKSFTHGIILENSSLDTIMHNTIFNMNSGLSISNHQNKIYAINNIIWREDDLTTDQIVGSDSLILFNNDISGTVDYNYGINVNNINKNPNFVSDSLYFGLTLAPTSECLDAGFTVLEYHTQFVNYYGEKPDIGAFESPYTPDEASISDNLKEIGWVLYQNYPNPFNPETTISYSVPNGYNDNVKLAIYNIKGQHVKTLVNKPHSTGLYRIQFNANMLSSGLYVYRLQGLDFVKAKKMILIK